MTARHWHQLTFPDRPKQISSAPRTCPVPDIASAVRLLRCKRGRRTMTKTRNAHPHSPPETRPYADAGATFNEAERVRRAAEEVREAAEVRREEREAAREAAEKARSVGEETRLSAEDVRRALVDSIRQTAATLQATLERM